MGRFADPYGDDNRLPEGMKLTGYDSDTGQRWYIDTKDNSTWVGAPYAEYGVLTKVADAPVPKRKDNVTTGRTMSSDDSSSKDRRAIHVTRHQTMPTPKSTGAGISIPTSSKASPSRRSKTVSQFPLPRRSIHSKHLKRSATTGTSTQRHLSLYSDGKDDSVSTSVKTHTKSTTPTPTPRNTVERNASKSSKTASEIKEKSPDTPPPIPSKTADDLHSLTPSKDATIRDSARRDQSSPDVHPEKTPSAEEAKTNSPSLRNMKRLIQLFKKS